MLFHKRHPRVGSRPGTLVIPPDSPPPRIQRVDYSATGVEEAGVEDPSGLAKAIPPGVVRWINIQGLGNEALLRQVAEEFGMHPLALEDAVNAPQRAKSELYANGQLVITRIPLEQDGKLTLPQICFFFDRQWILTFQERPFGVFDPIRQRIREGIGPIRTHGADYLAYAMIDTLVDGYYPVAERLSERLDAVEELVEGDPGPDVLSRLHAVRRQVALLRRVGWPQREAISDLIRSESPYVTAEVRLFLRDTLDHISQVVELLDSSREVAMALSEIYQSNLSQRTNEVMKTLTILASIFIPLTFIAGIYGMNFENMPELRAPSGYFTVLLIMVVVAAGMLLYFWHRGWIGGRSRRHDRES